MILDSILTKLFRSEKEVIKSYPPFFDGYNDSRAGDKTQYACYAPFKNIYFGHSGKAVACCYNRFHILGTYPENNIREIWFGEKTEELRGALKAYDFSHGCLSCLSQIKEGNYDAAKAKQYDSQRANANKYPSVMEFELDNTCNLECVMCSGDFSSLIRKNRENKPPLLSPYNEAFADQLVEFIPYLEEVKFYGGEPFMIPIYYKIWDLIVSINPSTRISIQTNATMLNSRIKDLLEKGNFHINISLDSVNKEIYEGIRINAKYDLVIENVKWFIDYCKRKNTFVGISACAMQQNWMDLPNILSFCNENDIQLYLHTVFFPKESAIRSMNREELNTILAFISSYIADLPVGSGIQKRNSVHFKDFVKQVQQWKDAATESIQSKSINTPEDFLNFVRTKLKQPEYQVHFDQDRREALLDKLNNLIVSLPSDMKITHLVSASILNDIFDFENMVRHIEASSIEELIKNIPAEAKQ